MSKYEQILGRPLTDAEKAKLAYAEQSRPQSAPPQWPTTGSYTNAPGNGVFATAGNSYQPPTEPQFQGQVPAAQGGDGTRSPVPNYHGTVPAAPVHQYFTGNPVAAQQPLVPAAPALPSNTPTGLQPSSAVVHPQSSYPYDGGVPTEHGMVETENQGAPITWSGDTYTQSSLNSGKLKPSGGKPEPLRFGASDAGDTRVWEDSMGAPFRADHPSLKQSQTLYADKGAKLKASMGAALAEKKKGK